MTNNHRYNHFVIFALILVAGSGLALAMPWLANAQGLSAQSEAPVQDNSPTATRYYVAKTGTGLNPTVDWSGAYTNVQDALAVAVDTSEIWVAKGVYYPDVGSGQINNLPTATFLMTDGVALYGGFEFGDTDFSDRDWKNNITVLSGDIDGNDTDTDGVVLTTTDIVGNNAYHVVTASGVTETAVVDGFTITAGKADRSYEDKNGGGFYCDGAGYDNNVCNPTLGNINFSGNYAEKDGGAMYNNGTNDGTSNPKLTNVIFSGNWADYGGAMHNDGDENGTSSPILTNVIFSGNSAVYHGGAMANDGRESGTSSPSLTNVTFSGNSAGFDGGAMYNGGRDTGYSGPSLTNVTFSGNSAGNFGGAMYNDGSYWGKCNPKLTNVIFSGNWADYGGAMFNDGTDEGTSSPILTNVTFSGNYADRYGGAMYNDGRSDGISRSQVRNSILWNNQDSGGFDHIRATIYNSYASITLIDSLIEYASIGPIWLFDPSYIDGGGNIDQDPMFITPINPSTAPTTDGNLRLQDGSPAINAGNNSFVTVSTDLDGNDRIMDGIVDMGAYEKLVYEKYLPLIFH